MMRTWSQGAAVHILRHVVVTEEWAHRVDEQLATALECLLSTAGVINITLGASQRMQVFLNIKDGGLGFGSAVMRR